VGAGATEYYCNGVTAAAGGPAGWAKSQVAGQLLLMWQEMRQRLLLKERRLRGELGGNEVVVGVDAAEYYCNGAIAAEGGPADWAKSHLRAA